MKTDSLSPLQSEQRAYPVFWTPQVTNPGVCRILNTSARSKDPGRRSSGTCAGPGSAAEREAGARPGLPRGPNPPPRAALSAAAGPPGARAPAGGPPPPPPRPRPLPAPGTPPVPPPPHPAPPRRGGGGGAGGERGAEREGAARGGAGERARGGGPGRGGGGGASSSRGARPAPLRAPARPTQPLEPILIPKLRIRLADFPYLHCSNMPEAVHLGDLLRIWVRPGARFTPSPPDFQGPARAHRTPPEPRRFPRHGPLSRGEPIPGRPALHKEKRTLPGAPAGFSGIGCVTALDASRRPSPPLRIRGSEPDSLSIG